MATYISFYEFSIKNDELFGHLGSGLASDIIERQITDPSIRLCMQEPCSEEIHYRIKCGIAEMTSTGPAPLPYDNEAEARGAWIRILPVGLRVFEILRDACQRHAEVVEAGLKTGWIKIEVGSTSESDMASARIALVNTKLTNPEEKVFVRFGGTSKQIRQALSLLNKMSI